MTIGMAALRVAIIGARGIGKFHAQWFDREGCQVVAFVTSSQMTLPDNEAALKSVIPNFRGRGYTDVAKMLDEERPDAISVCSPHHLHADHALLALERGIHVLCEKPLVWFGEERIGEAMRRSGEVVMTAQGKGRTFALNAQYAAAASWLTEIWEQQGLKGSLKQLTLTMQARLRERDVSGIGLWVDLAPHPLSTLLTLFPEGELDEESVGFTERPNELIAEFQVQTGGQRISVRIAVARLEGGLERSVDRDGFKVHFEPTKDEGGTYRLRLRWDGGERVVEDFMHTSVKRFIAAVKGEGTPLCDASAALRQTEWLFRLLRRYLEGQGRRDGDENCGRYGYRGQCG